MNVKKCVALLLSGMLFAGSLSACNRTIIEHQFHTNTEYITETVVETEVIEKVVNYSEDFQNLEKLLNKHGVRLQITVENIFGGEDQSGMDVDEKVEGGEMEDWLKDYKNKSKLNLVSEIDASIILPSETEAYSSYQLLEGTLKHISEYYRAFNELTPTQWENFPYKSSIIVINSSGLFKNGVFYVKTTIGTV